MNDREGRKQERVEDNLDFRKGSGKKGMLTKTGKN